jgi:hypothetical protein
MHTQQAKGNPPLHKDNECIPSHYLASVCFAPSSRICPVPTMSRTALPCPALLCPALLCCMSLRCIHRAQRRATRCTLASPSHLHVRWLRQPRDRDRCAPLGQMVLPRIATIRGIVQRWGLGLGLGLGHEAEWRRVCNSG